MAWIELHQSLINHPKIFHLAGLTGYSTDVCIGKLCKLWCKALEYAEDGDLSKFPTSVLAKYVDINTEEEIKKFFDALVESGFIDKNSLMLHDWLDYAGRYLKSKYHTSNPTKYKSILKKFKGAPKGKPKGAPKGDPPKITKPNLTQPNPKDTPALFERFWEAYPKKKSKGHAEKSFGAILPDEQLLARMISSIERAKTSDEWKRENGRFIPHPATWLNARRWEDEFDGGDNAGGKKGKYSGIGVTVEAEG